MKQVFTILIFLFYYVPGFGQSITERLIITDNKDSLLINAEETAFDEKGNYCFVIKEDKLYYFLTNKGRLGNFKFIGSSWSSSAGEILKTLAEKDDDEPWYYKNVRSTEVYGPVIGKPELYLTEFTKTNIALTTSFNDTIYYYVNNKLVSKNSRAEMNDFDISHYHWCSFSDDGKAIYYIKKDSLYYLFANGQLIDSSTQNFNELHINNRGHYLYAEGRQPKVKTNGYDYMFFVHTKDTVLGPVRTVWESGLTEENAYYYSGDDNGPYYIIINNTLKKGIKEVHNVIFPGKKNYFYKFREGNIQKVNVNGKVYSCPLTDVLEPTINTSGEFAFYGIKDYFLYKFINGKQAEKPITGYSVRPRPLYISPKGESLHYFATDDSVYLYQDDKMLFQPLAKGSSFKIMQYSDLFSTINTRHRTDKGSSLFYIGYGSAGYLVYNGVFSKPIMPAKEHSYGAIKSNGQMVAGALTQDGFFSIQKTGDKKYQVIINNKIYNEIDGLDTVLEKNCFFTDKELIFYGIKGLSIYQYKLSF